MALPNQDFGRAIREALQWVGWTPDDAAAALGIKPQTMNAMCSGIVPMRSLVIRFATEIGRRSEGQADAPDWWHDVDAWLAVAGYPPRRDFLPHRGNRAPVIRIEPLPPGPEPRPASHPPPGGAPRPVEGH